MMVRQPFCARKTGIIHTFRTANDLTPLQVFRKYGTAGHQKLCHRRRSETIAPQTANRAVPYVLNTGGGVKSFAVLFNHYNAQVSCKYRTAQAGQILAHKKWEFCIFFVINCCLTIITLLMGPKIII